MNIEELHISISTYSKELGFVDYGAAPCRKADDDIGRLKLFLEKSYNAGMHYLERNLDLREDPSLLMEGAKSVMCFLAPYKPECEQTGNCPRIASYAYGEDYHKVVKDRLYLIVERMKQIIPEIKARVFVDSAPVMERMWAKKAGLGFIGKNNFLISKDHGLHTFIGIILVDQVLKYSENAVKSGCGNCRSCLDACPTGALCEPFSLDARKCISYQTIESKVLHKEEEFAVDLQNKIFGCDICLNACPWSNRGKITGWKEFLPLFSESHGKTLTSFTKEDWAAMTEEDFFRIFDKSALKRSGITKILDNLGV